MSTALTYQLIKCADCVTKDFHRRIDSLKETPMSNLIFEERLLIDDNELRIDIGSTFRLNANYFEVVLLVFAMMFYKHSGFNYIQV